VRGPKDLGDAQLEPANINLLEACVIGLVAAIGAVAVKEGVGLFRHIAAAFKWSLSRSLLISALWTDRRRGGRRFSAVCSARSSR
jgi:hypothetical protein